MKNALEDFRYSRVRYFCKSKTKNKATTMVKTAISNKFLICLFFSGIELNLVYLM